jgi:hypothetical protein
MTRTDEESFSNGIISQASQPAYRSKLLNSIKPFLESLSISWKLMYQIELAVITDGYDTGFSQGWSLHDEEFCRNI